MRLFFHVILKPLLVLSFLPLCVSARQGTDSIPGLARPAASLNFLGLGDWGRNGTPVQQRVADVMGQAGDQLGIRFVISTGDNFYENGVRDVRDSQWISSFENIYTAPSLQVTWWSVLGNHDYILNPDAQVDYTREQRRWKMPARYFSTGYTIGVDSVLLVFIDTDPIEKDFLHRPYDPVKYPAGGVQKQLAWLREVLTSSHARWKIVSGHNPLFTGGSRRHSSRTRKMRDILQPVFREGNVDLYLCGHEHHLEYLKPPGNTHYVISGAGSENTHVGKLKTYRRFAARRKGFAAFSITHDQLMIRFISQYGHLLYSGSVYKKG